MNFTNLRKEIQKRINFQTGKTKNLKQKNHKQAPRVQFLSPKPMIFIPVERCVLSINHLKSIDSIKMIHVILLFIRFAFQNILIPLKEGKKEGEHYPQMGLIHVCASNWHSFFKTYTHTHKYWPSYYSSSSSHVFFSLFFSSVSGDSMFECRCAAFSSYCDRF